MGWLPPPAGLAGLAALVAAVVLVPQLAGWTPADRAWEVGGLTLAAMLTALLRVQQPSTKNRAIMPPSFVVTFGALLLFGPDVATLIAVAIALTPFFAFAGPFSRRQIAIDAAIAAAAIQFAGLAYRSLTDLPAGFVWPWHAVPIAAAVVAYHLAQGALAEVIVPGLQRQPFNRSWHRTALRGCPIYIVGASAAVAFVALIDHRMWEVLPVAAGSMLLRLRAVRRLREAAGRRAPPP